MMIKARAVITLLYALRNTVPLVIIIQKFSYPYLSTLDGVRPCSWHKLTDVINDCDKEALAQEVHVALFISVAMSLVV